MLEDELRLKVSLQPFKLLLNQSLLAFLLDLFSLDLSSPKTKHQSKPSQRKVKKPVFVSSLSLPQTHVLLSYSSTSLTLRDLPHQPLEFLNFMNLTDLRVDLPAFDLKQRLHIESATKHVVRHYVEDLIKNQKMNVAKAVGPIRTMVNVTGALVSLVSTPL